MTFTPRPNRPAYMISCTGPAPSADNPEGYSKQWAADDFAEVTAAQIERLADDGWPAIFLKGVAGSSPAHVASSVWGPIAAQANGADRQDKIRKVLIPSIMRTRAAYPGLLVGLYLGSFYNDLSSNYTTKETGKKILEPANEADYVANLGPWRDAINLEIYDYGTNLNTGLRDLTIAHRDAAAKFGIEVWSEAVPRPSSNDDFLNANRMPYVCRSEFIDKNGLRGLQLDPAWEYRWWFQTYPGLVPDPKLLTPAQRQKVVSEAAALGWSFVCQNGQFGTEILRVSGII